MNLPIISGLILFCIFANFSAIAGQQESDYKTKECTQRGISPTCDDELDHPIDDDKPFTIIDAIELIKSGVTTSKDLYEMGMITLEEKQQIKSQIMPERL